MSAVPLDPRRVAPGGCGRITATNTTSPTTGDMGGSAFTDHCPPGEVVIGFETEFSPGYYNNLFGQFVTLCGAVRVEDTMTQGPAVRIKPSSRVPYVIGRGPFNAPTAKEYSMCPPDQVVIGVEGQGMYPTRPVKMALRCASMTVAAAPKGCIDFVRGPVTIMPLIGKTSGTPFGPLDCPVGTVAWGSNLRAGEILNAYGLYCKSMSLVLGGN